MKSTNRVWSIILTVMIVLLLFPISQINAFDNSEYGTCINPGDISDPDVLIHVGGTFVSDGYVCCSSCGYHLYISNPSAHEHQWNDGVTIREPNCALTGVLKLTCAICGKIEYEELPMTEHVGGVIIKEPSCTEAGICDYSICKYCGVGIPEGDKVSVSPLGHGFTSYVFDNNATCLTDGTQTKTCSRCGETDTVPAPNTALGHDYDLISSTATCSCGGTETYKCSRCEDSYTKEVSEGTGTHSFTNYISDHNATCLNDGTLTAKCNNCDATDTIPDVGSALGHNFNPYVSDRNATCLNDGTKTAKCIRCEETKTVTDENSALGHTFIDYYSNNDATCEENGTKTAKCIRCEARDIIEDWGTALGHDYQKVIGADGKHHRLCTRCKKEQPSFTTVEVLSGITVNASDDSYSEQIVLFVSSQENPNSYLDKNYEKIAAWDIKTLVDNNVAQPNSPVFISIPLPKGFDANHIQVYHVSVNGNTERITPISVKNGNIEFAVSSFSVFVVVDESTLIATEEPSTQPQKEDTKQNLNFFQRIIQWFKNLFAKLFGR